MNSYLINLINSNVSTNLPEGNDSSDYGLNLNNILNNFSNFNQTKNLNSTENQNLSMCNNLLEILKNSNNNNLLQTGSNLNELKENNSLLELGKKN